MSEAELITAVKSGNTSRSRTLLDAGADANRQDEQGWTGLSWAAGRGDCETINLLLERGADVLHAGQDMRTASMIALAAGHADAAELLLHAEAQAGGPSQPPRKYCAAFIIQDFRRYSGWHEREMEEEAVAFLHQNYVVTCSIWDNEDIIFSQVTEDWKLFCDRVLQFRVPDDLDLITERQPASGSSMSVKAGIS